MYFGLREPVRFFIFFFGLLSLANSCFAQNREIDSMRTLLNKEKYDTIKVKTLEWICYDFYKRELYDSSIKYSKQTFIISDSLKYKPGIESYYENAGLIALDQGKYSDALASYLKAYEVANDIHLQKAIARSANGLGLVYFYTGDYPTSLKYYLESL